MSDNLPTYPQAKVQKQPLWSWVWLIPLVALIAGGWLVAVHYLEKGPTIIIAFDSSEGIEEGRTHIRYKDVDVGKVVNIRLQEYLAFDHALDETESGELANSEPQQKTRVLVEAQLEPFMSEYLTKDTRFWVVRPRVSANEISGLSTLFSGFYIGMDPGERDPSSRKASRPDIYEGLSSPPKVTTASKGVEIILNTPKLGSVNVGAPIYHRQLKVGEVVGYELSRSHNSVNVNIHIEEKYAAKITSNTRFWNVSGFTVEMTPNGGLLAHVESLVSVLIGGIAFDTPEDEPTYEIAGEVTFPLYDNYEQAWEDSRIDKLSYVVYFEDSLFGLSVDAPVIHQGIEIGKVESIRLQVPDEAKRARTEVIMSIHGLRFTDEQGSAAENILQKLVANGMRAQLKTVSLLTGAKAVSLVYDEQAEGLQLAKTSSRSMSEFPSIPSAKSLLEFDPSALSEQISVLVKDIDQLVSSKDTKRLLKESANAVANLQKLIKDMEQRGISKELVTTLQSLNDTLKEIKGVAATADKTLSAATSTLSTADKTMKQTLGDEAGLQYRLEVLIEDLGQAADAFSVLADSIQRKPNSLIFGN